MSPVALFPSNGFHSGVASGPSLAPGTASTSTTTIPMCSRALRRSQRLHTSFSLVATRKGCCWRTKNSPRWCANEGSNTNFMSCPEAMTGTSGMQNFLRFTGCSIIISARLLMSASADNPLCINRGIRLTFCHLRWLINGALMQILKNTIVSLAFLAACSVARAQAPDPQLLAEIQMIKAIDNHSHPPKLVSPGEKDDEFDALPCDPLEPSVPTTTSRPENPQYLAAWKALYNYPYDDATPEHVKEFIAARNKVIQQQGDNFPNWVLDQLGIETELANRIALGRGLQPPRFRWVPFDDALMFPLKNSGLQSESPDRKFFFSRENQLLRRYMDELSVNAMPRTLAEYTQRVITPSLELQKKQGAMAIKFEAAYLRSLDFGPVPPDPAADMAKAGTVYSHFIKG